MSSNSRAVVFSLVAACIGSLLVGWFVFHFDGFMGPDSGARFAMVRSWEHGGSPLFLDAAQHAGGARLVDPLIGYTVAVPRGICVVYPPLFTILSGILYFALGRAGLVVLPALGGVLAAYFTHRAAREWGLASSRFVAAIVFFGTPLVFYASTFWDHSIHAAIVAAAAWLLLRAHAGRTRDALVAGALVGAGVWFHELVLAAGVCFALALVPRRALLWRFCVGLAGPLALWMIFNAVVYGAVRGPHLMGPLEPNIAHFSNFAALRERATTHLAGGNGVRELLFVAGAVALVVCGFLRARRSAFAIAAALSLAAAWSMLSPGYAGGLFQVTPWLLFAFAERPEGADWRDEAHRTFVRAALFFIAVVIVTPVAPGLNWGGRYLLTMLPVLALVAIRTLERAWPRVRWPKVAVACHAALALFVFARGASTYRAKMMFDKQHARAVMRIQTRAAATDCWWLGPELEPTNFSTALALVAYVPATEQLAQPVPRDPDRVIRDAFFERLAALQLDEFSFVGREPSLVVMRAAAREKGWELAETHRESDLAVARFTHVARATATR